MKLEHFHDSEAGNEAGDSVTIPSESIFDENEWRNMWPASLVENTEFLKQIEERKRLIDALRVVQSSITREDVSFEQLLHEERMTEESVADLYDAVSDLLLNSTEYRRVILYMPFEYLLSSRYEPKTERLIFQAQRLKDAYMLAWNELLSSASVRANFVDGDVLETEKRDGDLPRVVKAAHLIPFLIQKGWLSVDDVMKIYETCDEEILKESIADTFGVLFELNLVDDDFVVCHGVIAESDATIDSQLIDADSLQKKIEARLSDVNVDDDSTEKRRAWLADVHRQKVLEEMGNEIQSSFEHRLITDETMEELMLPQAHVPSQLAFINGLRKEIERLAVKDTNAAMALYARFREHLNSLWMTEDTEVLSSLRITFFRLHHAGVIDRETLDALELVVPTIAGPFSQNLRQMDVETKDVQSMLNSIRTDAELMSHVYPVVMMYGSRLKGYGTKNADTDLGLFLRPGTPENIRTTIRAKIGGALPTEFWLEEKNDTLSVRDFDSHDTALGSSLWSHVLFGSAWQGDEDAMRELHARLLVPYFSETTEEMYGQNVRDLYLQSLEIDLLQYRLMHKGYVRYHSPRGGLKTNRAERMDGRSAFWDSGYRAAATKLFVEKIFLPRL